MQKQHIQQTRHTYLTWVNGTYALQSHQNPGSSRLGKTILSKHIINVHNTNIIEFDFYQERVDLKIQLYT